MIRKVSVLVVCVLALGAVACGQQSKDQAVNVDTGLDAHALAASADRTAQAGTAKVHLTMTVDAGSKAKGSMSSLPSMSGDGAYDTSSGLSAMTIDLGSSLIGKVETVQHGDVSYVRMGALDKVAPSLAGKWLKADGAKTKALAGSSSSLLTGTNGVGDPSAILDYLKGAGADITTVGHEEVGGVDTTHVHATVSMQQALDASGADRAKLQQSLDKMTGAGKAFTSLTLPIDVYVDGDGYVRRVMVDFDLSDSVGVKMQMTLDYSDFGQPVSITEPAAADTADICDLYATQAARHSTVTAPAGVC